MRALVLWCSVRKIFDDKNALQDAQCALKFGKSEIWGIPSKDKINGFSFNLKPQKQSGGLKEAWERGLKKKFQNFLFFALFFHF